MSSLTQTTCEGSDKSRSGDTALSACGAVAAKLVFTPPTLHYWMWLSTLAASRVPAPQLRRLGHARCNEENNGWCDLTKNRALEHGFLHACNRSRDAAAGAGPAKSLAGHNHRATITS